MLRSRSGYVHNERTDAALVCRFYGIGDRSMLRQEGWETGMKPQQQRILLVVALVGALVVTGLFAVRVLHSARHVRGGTAEQIRPWMPLRYIARSHDVPPHVLLDALGLTPESPGIRAPLGVIARKQNRPVSELIVTLEGAIKQFHAAPPNPPPPPEPTPFAYSGGLQVI